MTLLRFVDLLDFLVPVLLYEEFGIGLIGLERYGESCKVPGIPVTTRVLDEVWISTAAGLTR